MHNSIRSKLLIAFIGLATVPLLIVGILLGWQSISIQQQQALNLQFQTARRIATEVSAFIQEVENQLLFTTEVRGLDGLNDDQLRSLLRELVSYQDVYAELTLLDNEGQEQVRLSRLDFVEADDLEDRSNQSEFTVPQSSGETYFSPIWFDETTGEPLMTIAVPIPDLQSGLVDTVLVADVRIKQIETLIATSQMSLGENVYIVDARGQVVAHRDPSIVLAETRFELPSQDGLNTGLDSSNVILATETVTFSDQELTIVAEKSLYEALSLAMNSVIVIVGTIIIMLLVAGLIAYWLTRQIVNPIQNLVESAKKFSEGDLSQQVNTTSRDEIGILAESFNTMATQLHNLIGNLEERIKSRTQALETSVSISSQLITILDLDELLKLVVEQVKTKFEFYHTHIYLLDAETDELVMVEGSGQVGEQLKAKGHRLQAGEGIVGTVASTKQYFLSNNVNDVLNFVRNPLLPNTNSELAVPLRKGDEVLGVLDIQSEQLDRFSSDDVTLMQSIADQTAVAIDNARLLSTTKEAFQEVERLNRRLMYQAWDDVQKETDLVGYRFSRGVSQALPSNANVWLPPMKEAAAKRQLVKQIADGNGDQPKAELAVPLVLRGQVIGVLGVKREETPNWAEEEVSAVEAVADQITRALENARLSKEQEKTIGQLKEIDRLKSEFLTSMSHELRTPLNSIIGFADVLLQGIDGELPDMAISDIQLIHNSGQHLLALINDILDLSKIEAGKMELVREPLNVAESINDVLAASNSLVKDKPVEILVDKPDELPLVYADKLRLSQILLNLVSNAAKFTHEGSITIKANVDEENPERMRIAIIDTGIGIPEEKQQTIFDRFRQADGTTTRQYGGTGLGLAITLNLTEMHGGELRVKSEVDVGSEFYFTIPLADSIIEPEEAELLSDESLVST